ncbi:hypothetical protein CERZMDRAFT_115875 [Cercospora zeae-maydis SCOH1-5]|uniref:Uncharacterized protein n=1 Tax=Cercospora zeae-maydis SCOH1-5 TaxID=717836 RepID=A0A6A6F103_9PEZI|nr:hypothetical protein CERZMDRAFT_115875 [Cercospora zeae-maydis SCOH1-5]
MTYGAACVPKHTTQEEGNTRPHRNLVGGNNFTQMTLNAHTHAHRGKLFGSEQADEAEH